MAKRILYVSIVLLLVGGIIYVADLSTRKVLDEQRMKTIIGGHKQQDKECDHAGWNYGPDPRNPCRGNPDPPPACLGSCLAAIHSGRCLDEHPGESCHEPVIVYLQKVSSVPCEENPETGICTCKLVLNPTELIAVEDCIDP